jgi:glutamate-5-semialdehyde dehydrogenase
MTVTDVRADATALVRDAALRAREASLALATASRSEKDAALAAISKELAASEHEILQANARDIARGESEGMEASLLDRLRLTPERLAGISEGLHQLIDLPDPIGEVVRGSTLANGLELRQIRVPFGVVGIIYEARPNVTVDAAGITLKSGNAVLLRGSTSAADSNAAIVAAMRKALVSVGLPADAIQLIPSENRDTVKALLTARGLVDLVIPRGGAGLIKMVVEESSVPVIETGVGNCHVYVDETADLDKAEAILINAKVQRPSVCNSAETLLINSSVASLFLPRALTAMRSHGVTIHGDQAVVDAGLEMGITVEPATDTDWEIEYGTLDIAMRVVPDLDAAAEHIRQWGSQHTEAIITESLSAARRFIALCDSAAIMVNASTRFTDGEQFGFGAEIGISTQKLHARGPMALPEMTSTTWVAYGDGQIRP